MGRSSFGVVVLAGSVAGLASVAAPGRAMLYSPDDSTMSLPVAPDGKAQSLPLDEFKRRLGKLKNMPNADAKDNKDRDDVLKRIAARQRQRSRPVPETVALAADLIRTGKPVDAAGVLAAGDRRGYLVNVTLAHAHAANGDWPTAAEYLEIANDFPPPAGLPGLTPGQLAWQVELGRGPLAALFKSRWQDSRKKLDHEAEMVDSIFPVRFVNAAGQYEPANLDQAERAKLPPDAIAQVQQLGLWMPHDTRLYWLLGELYAADGQLDEAETVVDDCVSEARQYGSRAVLKQHRELIKLAAAEKRKPPPEEELPISMRTVWIYFGAVGLVAVFALVRATARRARGDCGPTG